MFDSSFFETSAKIIFVTNGKFDNQAVEFFDFFGILNYVVIEWDESWKFMTFNRFCYKKTNKVCEARVNEKLSEQTANIDLIFPDKLKDMYGYNYQSVWTYQALRVIPLPNKILLGIDIAVLSLIGKHQNSKVNYSIQVNDLDPERFEKTEKLFSERVVDLSLSTNLKPRNISQQQLINTYDEEGFCALVPIPPRLSFLSYIFMPFDTFSWILMALTTFISGTLWRLLNRGSENSTSLTYFVLGVIANFLGQSIPFARNRRIQMILLQLCILMTFIMGNAYQSLIIATMSWSRDGIRLTTFDELFESNYNFSIEDNFLSILNSSKDFSVNTYEKPKFNWQDLAADNVVVALSCDKVMTFFYSYDRKPYVHDHYYKLPDETMKLLETLSVPKHSPFFKRFQRYYDRFYESGIRSVIKKSIRFKKRAQLVRDKNFYANEDYLLKFDDVHGVFYILAFGLLVAFLSFLCEIFQFAFLGKLKLKKKKKSKRVRRTQIQPVASSILQ